MIYIDPQTRQRVVYDPFDTDIQYDLVGDSAISEETVPVIGNWEDYTGSATVNSRTQQMWAGESNQLFGQDPSIESGEKVGDLGEVGQNRQTTRRRQIKRYVDLTQAKHETNQD